MERGFGDLGNLPFLDAVGATTSQLVWPPSSSMQFSDLMGDFVEADVDVGLCRRQRIVFFNHAEVPLPYHLLSPTLRSSLRLRSQCKRKPFSEIVAICRAVGGSTRAPLLCCQGVLFSGLVCLFVYQPQSLPVLLRRHRRNFAPHLCSLRMTLWQASTAQLCGSTDPFMLTGHHNPVGSQDVVLR